MKAKKHPNMRKEDDFFLPIITEKTNEEKGRAENDNRKMANPLLSFITRKKKQRLITIPARMEEKINNEYIFSLFFSMLIIVGVKKQRKRKGNIK
ncbi:MAG: hypothetical protein ABIC19_01290 [Patescibacteria group bacterium]